MSGSTARQCSISRQPAPGHLPASSEASVRLGPPRRRAVWRRRECPAPSRGDSIQPPTCSGVTEPSSEPPRPSASPALTSGTACASEKHQGLPANAEATQLLGGRLERRLSGLETRSCDAAAPCPFSALYRSRLEEKGRVRAASLPSDRGGRLLRTAARMQAVGYEQAVEELIRDRALSNCGRHPFHGTVSSVAGGENPRHARLEQKRTAIERPSVAAAKIRSREDETLRIPIDLRWQPLSVRARADH